MSGQAAQLTISLGTLTRASDRATASKIDSPGSQLQLPRRELGLVDS
jgi:hypothetical protein